jgi:hypothetical protein
MTELNYILNEGVLLVQGKVIDLPYPAVQALDFQGLIVVRVEPAIGETYNRNVFALDGNGSVKWQIAESPHGTEDDKPYTSISIREGKKLVAGNWNGVDYAVAFGDGSITTESFNK